MSAIFLLLAQRDDGAHDLDALARRASALLPLQPQRHMSRADARGRLRLEVWTNLEEASRGGWMAERGPSWLVYDGWCVEPQDASLERSVAQTLLDALGDSPLDALTATLQGGYCIMRLRQPDGADRWPQIEAATDAIGERHLYYGSRDGLAVLSNRALMVASALHGGQIPRPSPLAMAWLLSSIAAPHRDQTPWPDVRCLSPDQTLRLRAGRLTLHERLRPAWTARELEDFDAHFARLMARLGQLARLPAMSWRLALTGGKDSRAVLAGLVGARLVGAGPRLALPTLRHAYLRAPEGHADVLVGRRLAAHYDLPFERLNPAPDDPTLTLWQRLDQHNALTECQVHAYDLKSITRAARGGGLHGNLGELYRSHAQPGQALGWPWIERRYTSDEYLNRQGLLTDAMTNTLRQPMRTWLHDMRDQGIRPLEIHDRIHRLARMHRWVGQTQQADSLAAPSINPLGCPTLLAWYDHASLAQRRAHRAHLELIRRADDWLWRQPFAQQRWSRLAIPHQPASMGPERGQPTALAMSAQRLAWDAQRGPIHEYLMTHDDSPYFDVVDRDRQRRLLDRMNERPDPLTLKAIFGCLGIKRALTEPLVARPITLETDP